MPKEKTVATVEQRLNTLYLRLERERKRGSSDWQIARALEDRIGSGTPLEGDVQRAESLLEQYGL